MTDSRVPQAPASLPDKRQVAASFSRAAESYDGVADLQRAVGNHLLEQLPADLQPSRWLDLGCGTGHFSRLLALRFAGAEGLALDIAEGMLRTPARWAVRSSSSPVMPRRCRCATARCS